jgi:hypothetical protein
MQEDWLDHTTRVRDLREQDSDRRWWADRDKLPRKLRIVVDAMIYLFPPRGDPGIPGTRSENEVEKMLIDRLKVTHPAGVTFGRTLLWQAIDFARDGKLPPKRPRRR